MIPALLRWGFMLKRVGGIEPPSLAWKAKVLPLNYTRIHFFMIAYFSQIATQN